MLRRLKQARRIARAEAEILARQLSPAPHGLRAPLIVSLTSYPARFASLHLVLRSVLQQTVRADRVILWLDEGIRTGCPLRSARWVSKHAFARTGAAIKRSFRCCWKRLTLMS
ncbi:hypothetical protein ACFSS8_08530 [Paracoccus kondratievae]